MVVEFNHLLPTMPELGMGLPNDYTPKNAPILKMWRRGFERHTAHSLRESDRKRTPVRLADEDTALSRRGGGFDSLTGDSPPQAHTTGATGGAGGLQNRCLAGSNPAGRA